MTTTKGTARERASTTAKPATRVIIEYLVLNKWGDACHFIAPITDASEADLLASLKNAGGKKVWGFPFRGVERTTTITDRDISEIGAEDA